MRYSAFFATMGFLMVIIPTPARADESEALLLKFDQNIEPLTPSALAVIDRWKYYITQRNNAGKTVRDSELVKRYIVCPANDDVSGCRMKSQQNWVCLARLVHRDYEKARRLSWKWSVERHPPGGTLGSNGPHDAAMTIYVLFRKPKATVPLPKVDDDYDYTILGFCWTANTRVDHERDIGRMPWAGSPEATIYKVATQNLPQEGEESESVDLREEYTKAFHKDAPAICGVVLMADSNDIEPDDDEMITDAVIRDIRFYK